MKFEIDKLNSALASVGCASVGRVHWFDELPSTNNFIAQHPDPHGRVCLAGLQTEGRGQRGKQWQAPFMSSVLMSFGWVLNHRDISGLSLVCGLAVKRALEDLQVSSVALKWPNDVLLNGQKLGGILVEVVGQNVVVGLGLNMDLGEQRDDKQYPTETNLPWTDLARNGYQIDLHSLVATLIVQLTDILEKFMSSGFSDFRDSWEQAHYFQGKTVQLNGAESVSGEVMGVDPRGGLVLNVEGVSRAFYAGNLSMSPVREQF